jgi:hypothetical protein
MMLTLMLMFMLLFMLLSIEKNHAMESETHHQSRVSGKNQLRRGKPRVRIACVMMMLMMCRKVAAVGVVDDEETEELPPISRRRMSCRVGAGTAFR